MNHLGVDINLSKSLVSKEGVAEFAKKIISSNVDLSPLGPKSIFEFIKSPLHLKDLIINYSLIGEDTLMDKEVLVTHLTKFLSSAPGGSSQK